MAEEKTKDYAIGHRERVRRNFLRMALMVLKIMRF